MSHKPTLKSYFGDDRPVVSEAPSHGARWPLQAATQIWEQADTSIRALIDRLNKIEGVSIRASFTKEVGGAPNKASSIGKVEFSEESDTYRVVISGCNARTQNNVFAFEEYKLFKPVSLVGSIDNLLRAESDPAATDITTHRLSEFVGVIAGLTKEHYPDKAGEIDQIARGLLAEKPPQTGIVQQRIEPTF
jgi:hypothetical protein